MNFTSEISLKIRTAIKVKLAELGNDVYEELPDYIMVMVANRRGQDQMSQDLSLFLGANTDKFTSWLHSLLSKLQSVASVSPEEKGASGNGNANGGEDDTSSKNQEPENEEESEPESDHNADCGDDDHSDHESEHDNGIGNHSDRASEHSNDGQSSLAVLSQASGDDATKAELNPKEKDKEDEDEQSESDSSLQKSDSRSEENLNNASQASSNSRSEENSNNASQASNNDNSVTGDNSNSASQASNNDPSVTGDLDSNKPQNQTESVSVTDNGNSKSVVKKRKKHSTRVFRVKSRKLEAEGDSSKPETSTVSSSKATEKQGSDGSDSENETRSCYTLTEIRKMKENSVPLPVSEVTSTLVKMQQPEEKTVDVHKEMDAEQTMDQGDDNKDKDDIGSDTNLQQ